MGQKYKKIFSVLLAILVGAGVVFFAWRSGDVVPPQDPHVVNTTTEWKDTLSVIPQAYKSKTLGASNVSIDVSALQATTTTDIIARKLLAEYVSFQKNSATTTISDKEAERIAYSLLKEIKLPQKKDYKLGDLNISDDNSREANLLYISTVNELTKELLSTPEKETDLMILKLAVDTNSATTLSKLKPKIAKYEALIKNLLKVKTPSSVAPIHLHLIQSFETLRSATVGLQSILVDSIIGLTAISQYREWIDEIVFVRQEYKDFFEGY